MFSHHSQTFGKPLFPSGIAVALASIYFVTVCVWGRGVRAMVIMVIMVMVMEKNTVEIKLTLPPKKTNHLKQGNAFFCVCNILPNKDNFVNYLLSLQFK